MGSENPERVDGLIETEAGGETVEAEHDLQNRRWTVTETEPYRQRSYPYYILGSHRHRTVIFGIDAGDFRDSDEVCRQGLDFITGLSDHILAKKTMVQLSGVTEKTLEKLAAMGYEALDAAAARAERAPLRRCYFEQLYFVRRQALPAEPPAATAAKRFRNRTPRHDRAA